jgi:hypothetical protein
MRPALGNLVTVLTTRGRPRQRAPLVLVTGLVLGLAFLLAMQSAGARARAPGAAGARTIRADKSGVVAGAARAAAGSKRVYWGAWIGNQFTGVEAPWDMNAVAKFTRLTGKRLSLIHFSSPFADCRSRRCVPYIFPTQAFSRVRSYGAIPFFSWGSIAKPIRKTASRYALRTIVAGKHDAYIRAWAIGARNWGHPFFLQYDWEMNGSWYPWSEGVNGNRPGEFVRAWRHVHDIFTKVGATNVTWVWCPNADPGGVFSPLYPLYPGRSYVDWTCINVYNRNKPWLTFDTLFRSTYSLVSRIAPTKPIAIGEIGSTEKGGSKAGWITDVLTQLPVRYPLVRAFLWFEKYDSGYDWPIETSKSSTRAFARGIASPLYASNVFDALPAGRIRPPS